MRFAARVLMFGQSGVGKTSLVAAMFHALQVQPAFAGLATVSERSHDLEASLQALRRHIRTLADGKAVPSPSTQVKKSYPFTVDMNEIGHGLAIEICDMPGDWLKDPGKRSEWISLIRTSDIIINVISAPAMMEESRQYNEDINKPSRFGEYLAESLAESTDTKCFVFAPVKCEKYSSDGAELQRMHAALQQVYHNHRVAIRNAGHICYALPVDTLGTVVFDRFSLSGDGDPVDHYKCRTTRDVEWRPKNHDALVAHILDYYLSALALSFPRAAGVADGVRTKLSHLLVANELERPAVVRPRKFNVPRATGCFGPETEVMRPDGTRMPIALAEAGTKVLTIDREGRIAVATVKERTVHRSRAMIDVTFTDRKLRVTPSHLLLTRNGWKQARELAPGDQVIAADDATTISALAVSSVDTRLVVDAAYNLYTDPHGSYLASGVVASSYAVLAGLRRLRDTLRHVHTHVFPARTV